MILNFFYFFIWTFLQHCKACSTEKYRLYININFLLFHYLFIHLFMTQYKMDYLSQGCDNFSLTISTKKAEATYQPAPGKPYQEPHIMVKGRRTCWRVVCVNADVNNRIAKTSVAFGRLCENVWEWRGISLSTKLKVYHAVILATLCYSC